MSFFTAPGPLESAHVRIVPMNLEHAEGLFEIGVEPSIWQWLPEPPFQTLADSQLFIERALANQFEYPFVILHLPTRKVAGTTRYLEISEANRSLEIGWTWYGTDYQRTAVNTECKLLLMQYAFETLGAIRLQLKTDGRNLRSQAAIQRAGGKLEGTLRKHRILPKDSYIRDSVYFSVLDEEWPDVKAILLQKLAAGASKIK